MPKVKRLNKIIHPNSRRAKKLAAVEHHNVKITKSLKNTTQKNDNLVKKLLWFRNQIGANPVVKEVKKGDEENEEEMVEEIVEEKDTSSLPKQLVYTISEMHEMLQVYLARFEDELGQIETKNAIGKRAGGLSQNFSRQKAIQMTLDGEKHMYETSGIVTPDLTSTENVLFLRNWRGHVKFLPAIKMKHLKKNV